VSSAGTWNRNVPVIEALLFIPRLLVDDKSPHNLFEARCAAVCDRSRLHVRGSSAHASVGDRSRRHGDMTNDRFGHCEVLADDAPCRV
jgi:hypothetical protein